MGISDEIVFAGVIVALLAGVIPPIENFFKRRSARVIAAVALSSELERVFINAESARRLVEEYPVAKGQCYRAIEYIREIDLQLTGKVIENLELMNVASARALSLVMVNKDIVQRDIKNESPPENPLERSSVFVWKTLQEQCDLFATYARNAYVLATRMAGIVQSPAVNKEIEFNVCAGTINKQYIVDPA